MIWQNFFQQSTKIILILIGAYLLTRIVRIFIVRLAKAYIEKSYKTKGGKNGQIREHRERTLASVFISTFNFIVWGTVILKIISELGFNIAPLLGGAGIAALAIGMGSRTLIQDYLSGLFLLLEDQYRVGEEVEIATIKGRVKNLNLRRTVLENPEGTIFFIPNGQINRVSNFSRKSRKKIKK